MTDGGRGPGGVPRARAAQGALAVAAVRRVPVQRDQPAGPRVPLPRTVALSTGTVLDAAVQQRLVDHVAGGGSLLLTGRLPERDPENRPCTVLADASVWPPASWSAGTSRYFPSVVGHGLAAFLPETRVGWLAESGSSARACRRAAVHRCRGTDLRRWRVEVGAGRAVVVTAELPRTRRCTPPCSDWLGCTPGLRLRTTRARRGGHHRRQPARRTDAARTQPDVLRGARSRSTSTTRPGC